MTSTKPFISTAFALNYSFILNYYWKCYCSRELLREFTIFRRYSIRKTAPYDSFDSRYIGDDMDADSHGSVLPARAPRFVGRIDVHNAHKSGLEVSGRVSWTLMSEVPRKMELRGTLKAKAGWFGYSAKASSRKVSVWPGGGRGKAAVARYQCKGSKNTKWYTYGEGFATGTQKSWGYNNGTVVTLRCGA